MSKDLYTLAAIAALESGSPQGQADVAQSVYNRLQAKYGSSITAILTAQNQYQPAFIDPSATAGPKTAASPEFVAITDENSAVKAMASYYRKREISISESSIRQQLRGSVAAIQNPTYQQNARNFVGNRTEFRAPGAALDDSTVTPVWRGSTADNRFGIQYGDAKNKAGQNPPASVPTSISGADPQNQTTENQTTEDQDEGTTLPIDGIGNFDPSLFEVSDVICRDCQKDPIPESTTSGKTIIQADPCKDNTLAKVEAYLTNFFDKVTKVGNAILNLPNEINFVVDLIGSTITGFTNKMLGTLSNALSGLINNGINALTTLLVGKLFTIPAIIGIQTPLIGLGQKLFDGIFCAATKVLDGAKGALKDLINSSVKNVLNAGQCVVEQVMGAFTNNLTNIVDSIVGPLLKPITNILNGFGTNIFSFNIKDFLLTGINAIRKIANLFECGDKKLCPASSKYIIDKGLLKDQSEEDEQSSFDRIFSGTAISQGASNLVGDFERQYGKWTIFGSKVSEASDLGSPCNFGNVTECGLPTVSFFGGDGLGAAGNAILGGIINNVDAEDAVGSVAKVGSIVGVEMTNPGQNYTRAPIVTFQDSCNKGYGAYGRAIIQDGKVTGVVITSEGENYPADIGELPLFIDEIVVEDPGENYANDDKLEGVDLEIINGRVISATPQPSFAFNGLPNLNIQSSSGFGAVLRPIMTTVQPTVSEIQEFIDVIDCIDTQLVGYVNGAPYYGPFHKHVRKDGTVIKMVGRNHINSPHSIIYETREESLKNIKFISSTSQMRSITNQVTSNQSTSTETSEQTSTTNTTSTSTSPTSSTPPSSSPPPSTPPSPPPSTPPSGGYGGY